jgi:type VI protein secretion system component VasF
MTLLELCEPLFQYVSLLNQRANLGDHPDPAQVEADVEGLLAQMRGKAAATPGLLEQFERVEMPLIFFVDNVIYESKLSFARQWPRLAYRRNEMAGDEKFFHMLDDELKGVRDRNVAAGATERLAVYYTCLGLGFTGWHVGEPDVLRKYMKQLEPRVRQYTEVEEKGRLTKEAYDHTLTEDWTEPPARSLTKIVIALIGLIIVLFVGNAYLYHSKTSKLETSFERIKDLGKGGQQ